MSTKGSLEIIKTDLSAAFDTVDPVGLVSCGAIETGAVRERFTKDSSKGDGPVGGSGGVILTFTS